MLLNQKFDFFKIMDKFKRKYMIAGTVLDEFKKIERLLSVQN